MTAHPPSNHHHNNHSGHGSHPAGPSLNFIEHIIEADNAKQAWGVWRKDEIAGLPQREGQPRVHTRFPPEPNGYLHVGHAKAICLNYGLAKKYSGKFNLRFDDTNPSKEDQEYIDAIKRDVAWLIGSSDASHAASAGPGNHFEASKSPFGGGLFHASDLFETMYKFAEELIHKDKAYVCQLTGDEVSARRGKPGVPATSPHRDRPIDESIKLFREMKAGKHPNGAMTLRAKIDLASPNFNLRDPVMYRIVHESHPHAGSQWCIYPMYDWAHGLEDSHEGITHSICTLEFEDHRPLYDWFINAINEGRGPQSKYGERIHHAQQIEFAKFRPTYTVTSKRNLLKMVESKIVNNWDDPRMPTLAGMRRRGFTPESLQNVCHDIGVTKVESMIDFSRLENAVRDHLNRTAPRAMAVLRPLKVTIENWPKDAAGKPVVEELDFTINPEDASASTRKIKFSGELFIEQDDFAENPPKGFFRLAPGTEVRLRWAYFIQCTGVDKDATGNITGVRATYDPATKGGDAPPGPDGKPRKVKGTLHWVSAHDSITAEVRLFERLFAAEEPGSRTGNWIDDLNPNSLEVIRNARLDPWLADARFGRNVPASHNRSPEACPVGDRFQFERLGYFCVDRDSKPGHLVFNRTVTLKEHIHIEPAAVAGAGQASSATRGANVKPAGKGSVRLYSLKEAAHEFKIKQDKLETVIARYTPPIADYAAREPKHLTLDEVRAMKDWLKKNPLPKD